MKILASIIVLVSLTSISYAADQTIKVERKSYFAGAALHLKILQSELALEALKVCGSKKAVKGLTDINIQITEGIGSPVATLARTGEDLDLNYPMIEATATVQCVD